MKTKIFLNAILLTLLSPLFSPAQNFQWVNNPGGTNSDNGRSVAIDNSGNVYATGYYNSASITFGTTTFNNTGSYDIYLVKYDPNGNVLWARTAVGSSYNYAYSVATDCGVGHVIITGAFGGTITFGSTTLTNTSGSADVFIAEYDANGNVLWAKSAAGGGSEFAYGVTTDYSCNVYITGYFDSPTLTLGTTTLTNTSPGWQNVFLAKYDTSGNIMWARSAGGSGNIMDEGKSVAFNNYGIFITGQYTNSITFGSNTLTSTGLNDMFLVNYDLNGNVLWAKSAGGVNDEVGVSIAANSNTNNVYVTGHFGSPVATFGSTLVTNTGVFPFYYDDIFLAKFDSAGNVLSVQTAGGKNQDRAGAMDMDLFQNTYITGMFEDTITFGAFTLISAGGASDIYIVKYDPAGNVCWAKSVGGTNSDYAHGLVVRGNGSHLFLTGKYSSPAIAFDAFNFTNTGSDDIFVARLNDLTIGVANNTPQTGTTVYPNPSSGIITITSELKEGEISIYNMLGEKIFSSAIDQAKEKGIDVSGIANGVYFLLIKDGNKSQTQSIIIQH